MTFGRRCAGATLVALAVAVGVAGFARPANAVTAYRYWTYYVAAPDSPTWVYSQRGPASEHPQDGEVQGWRFAIQADRGGGRTPRDSPDFATLCGTQQSEPGKVRVGVVLDFGVADDAPAGERPPAGVVTGCVQIAQGGNGVDVLDAAVGAANVRIGQGLICGIDGYPKTECAVVVAAPAPTQPQPPTPSQTATAAAEAPKPPAATAESSAAAAAATAPATPPPATRASGATTSGPAPAASSTSPSVSSAAGSSAPTTTLSALKKPSHNGFPTGAVIGAGLVVGLGIAAAVRAVVTRR